MSFVEWNRHIASNRLTGTIPREIGGLSQIRSLYWWSNSFTGSLPTEIGKLETLSAFGLWHANHLTGTLPSLKNLRRLTLFVVSGSDLTGNMDSLAIPDGKLRYLHVTGSFSGTIPDFSTNVYLETLFISGAKLRGTPELSQNIDSVLGTIPATIGKLEHLRILGIYNSPISGTVPSSILDIPLLKYFHLGSNKLSGTFPPNLSNATKYELLCTHHTDA